MYSVMDQDYVHDQRDAVQNNPYSMFLSYY